MAKYQVWVKAEVDIDIEADNELEAIEKAEMEWYEALKHNGTFEIDDIYCYEED